MARNPLKQKQRRILLSLAGLILSAGLQTNCTSCTTSKSHLTAAQSARLEQAARTPPPPPQCQPLKPSGVQLQQPAIGQHRVTLSWKASVPTPNSTVVGYCVYRTSSATEDPFPGLLNSTPVKGTTCVDNRVTNDTMYHYAVAAIDATSLESKLSKGTTATIPKTPAKSSLPSSSTPSCWMEAATAPQ
jgi:hypothetical protein